MISDVFDSFSQDLKKPEISMAPLIDMVFLLLIFFVVTTTFTKETGIKVDKARAATSMTLNKNLMVISISQNGEYWYDKSSRSIKEIISIAVKLTLENSELNIVVVPDKHGEVDFLITLLDKLRAKDIHRFSLGTQLTDK